VSKTYTRDWDGEDGTVVLHSFQLNGDKRYFRTGTDQLVSEGDYITFDIAGNNTVVPESLQKGKAQPAQTAPKPAGTGTGWGGRKTFDKPAAAGKSENFEARQKYWEDKERRDIEVVEPRITFSAAQRDAIEIVKVALEKDLLSFGNAAKAAKLPMLLDFVDEVTARFYAQRIDAAATAAQLMPPAEESTGNGGDDSDDE